MAVGEMIKCVELHRAAMRGDWRSAINDPKMKSALMHKITDKHETALHIAAALNQHHFVASLLKYLRTKLGHTNGLKTFLEIQNSSGNTALCYAAFTGDVSIAKAMVEAYDSACGEINGEMVPLGLMLPNLGTVKPVLTAACLGHTEMVEYLLGLTDIGDGWSKKDRNELFIAIIHMGLYDKALMMLEIHQELAIADNECDIPLHVLARTPSAFLQKDQPFWKKCWNYGTKVSDIDRSDSREVIKLVEKLCTIARERREDIESTENDPEVVIAQTILLAAEEGNTELVIHLLRSDPGLIWKVLPENRSIFHIAIEKRHESIFTLLHEFGAIKDLIADNLIDGGNNMLHLAAELAPQSQLNAVSGAALQMQRELFWFKEVEKIVRPSYRDRQNSDLKTPEALFNEEHKNLRHAGEKWMKDTAKSCMLVATLIATVMFTAIFTVPGGYNNDSGKPLLQHHHCFWVFSLSDAVSLFSASTSIFMFLSILTSRYAEMDFLYSLLFRLTIGVTSLFVSVGSMMVAFCATFVLYYPRDFLWFFASFGVFAVVPLGYVSFKYPLLADLVVSVHRSSRMFRWPKRLVV